VEARQCLWLDIVDDKRRALHPRCLFNFASSHAFNPSSLPPMADPSGRKITRAGADIQLKLRIRGRRKRPDLETRLDRNQMFNHSLKPYKRSKAWKHRINWFMSRRFMLISHSRNGMRTHLNAYAFMGQSFYIDYIRDQWARWWTTVIEKKKCRDYSRLMLS